MDFMKTKNLQDRCQIDGVSECDYSQIESGQQEDKRKLLWQCIDQGDYRQAEMFAAQMLKADPNDRELMGTLAAIYIETEQQVAARKITKQLLQYYPDDGYSLFLAARVEHMAEAWAAVVSKAKKALRLRNLTAEIKSLLYNLLGSSYRNLGDSLASSESYLQASRYSIDRQGKAIDYSNYLFNLHYLPEFSQEELYRAHCGYNDLFAPVECYTHKKKRRHKRIRLGYISPDIRHHVVMSFSYALFQNYDKVLFEVFCYAKCSEDHISRKIAGMVDSWRNINDLDAEAAAQCIYDDEIDILFDLSGHTKDNCLPILAYKPAPVQLSGIGYFDTTGLQTVDYFLADVYTDPNEQNDACFTETLLRLPDSHFCYMPPDMMPECAGESHVRKTGYITFGSFNNFTKTTDEMLLVWRDILERVQGSKLLLKSRIFGSASGRKKITKRLKSLGFELRRVEMRPETDTYLAEYNDVDIALDTYPYPGGGTTCEALYMGVPVITLVGERHGARFGYSLLKNIGLGKYCAFTKAEYVEIAVRLANNRAQLEKLHRNLREQMKNSPLMDGKTYMHNLEKLYLRIWEAFLAGQEMDSPALRAMVQKKAFDTVRHALQKNDWSGVVQGVQLVQSFGDTSEHLQAILPGAYFKLQDYDRAIEAANNALLFKIDKDAELYVLIGHAYREKLDYVGALKAFTQADECLQQSEHKGLPEFQMEIKKAMAHLQTLLSLTEQGALAYQQGSRLAASMRDRCEMYSSYLLSLHYRETAADMLYQAHQAYSTLFTGIELYMHHNRKSSQGKIKIGYITGDFHQHVMFYFYHQLLACYDKKRFSVTCYSMSFQEDAFTKHLQALVDDWHTVSQKTYSEIAKQIYTDGIDILIDLAGHSAGSGLPVLAYKPAPIQVAGLGYVDTTGLDTIDYFLTDEYVDPIGVNDIYFTEKLLRLPDSHFCYTGRSDVSFAEEAPCRKKGFVTFASFNQYAKITDMILEAWLNILQQTEDSQLWLKSQVFVSTSAIDLAQARLQRIGYDLERVLFLPATDNYMEAYLDVDIALDTYPYPGGGTTCDALYMGVPVITMYGKSHGSRFGYSILKNVGLDELAVPDAASYVAKAVALAHDTELLDVLHKNLRRMMLQSPLMDENLYMKQIESIYQKIYDETFGKMVK